MRNKIIASLYLIVGMTSCTKKIGVNKDLAYTDKALFDSCQKAAPYYYLNDSKTIYLGNNGLHGKFKLRFNSIALNALTQNGKLPEKTLMPEGSLIVKDINGSDQYALMYKKSGNWLWAEYKSNKEIIFSVGKNASLCTNCHSQSDNRDFILSFKFY